MQGIAPNQLLQQTGHTTNGRETCRFVPREPVTELVVQNSILLERWDAMEQIQVYYKSRKYKCHRYTCADEPNILAIVPAWRAYAAAVARIGKAPQVPSAFSQAFCCFRLGLVEKPGRGVDAFRLNGTGNVIQAVEIKATATVDGRNDIRLYSKSRTGPVQTNCTPFDLDFDELCWLRFMDTQLHQYEIYRILPEHIKGYTDTMKKCDVRGGRVNVAFRTLVERAGLQPVDSGETEKGTS